MAMKNQICVKMTIYDKHGHASEVVYYRNKITIDMSVKWRWYFEYLAALIKIKFPRNKVELFIGVQDLLQGKEYIEKKTNDLLSFKKGQLKKYTAGFFDDDIFNFTKEKQNTKIERIKQEIEDLEQGKFKYYVPAEYINNIKQYLKR